MSTPAPPYTTVRLRRASRMASSDHAASAPSRSGGAALRIVGPLWAWILCPTVFLFSAVPLLNLYARGALGAFIAWFVLVAVLGRRRVFGVAPVSGFLLWGVFALAASLLASDLDLAFRRWLTVFLLGMLSLAVYNTIVWSGNACSWCHAYIVSAILAYLSNYLPVEQYLTVEYETEILGRYAGTLGNANMFGRSMTQAFLLGVALLVGGVRPRHGMLIILAMGVLGLAVIESSSRTAMLGLALGVLALFACVRARTLVTPLNFVALWAVAGAIAAVFTYIPGKFETAVERMSVFFSFLGIVPRIATSERSIDERVALARRAVDVTLEHPLGVGLNNFSTYVGTYAHSNFLEVLVSTGLLGLLFYLAGFVVFALQAGRAIRVGRERRWWWFMLWAMATVAVMNIFNVSYYAKTFWVFVSVLCGASALHYQRGPGPAGTA